MKPPQFNGIIAGELLYRENPGKPWGFLLYLRNPARMYSKPFKEAQKQTIYDYTLIQADKLFRWVRN
ncbi:MAG TPA: hypothetical protein DCP32_13015 [Anaerolineaceae bacterium]|nr:MAG: hypothetical protein A2X24_06265 [Chloroflexi bacterium GWB2_54_36]HAL17621.1 hypothetical protein [Anaerolineaceae bacterium]